MDKQAELKGLLQQVRARWVAVTTLTTYARAAAIATVVLAVALGAFLLVRPVGLPLLGLASLTLMLVLLCFGWMGWMLRRRPTDVRVARLIEEACPELEDRIATAVQYAERPDARSGLIGPLMADAAASIRRLNLDRIVSARALRRAAAVAAVASVIFGAAMYSSRTPARQAYAVAALYAFPSRVGLEVVPGDTRVRAGQPLKIVVRLSGAGAVLTPRVAIEGRTLARDLQPTGHANEFALVIDAVSAPFKYSVTAGALTSRAYSVSVLRAPRVTRIDLQYAYPPAFGLAPRTEEDGGDIYAPAGTTVRVRVKADKAIQTAEMVMADGTRVKLSPIGDEVMGGELKVAEDGSYRVALADHDGLDNPGDTEYFIRTLDDRPPDVRILRPAGDRQVTPLEEVGIEARAEDDYGISQFDLVYSVRGGPEKAVPFRQGGGLSVTGAHTLYLEDLGVQPGDFVSYYARARDVSRGKRSTEARSDIFFLEVKPYAEEFTAAQSNAMGAGASQGLDDLAAAQKEIIIATWKLERRSQGGRSQQDIQSVGRAQRELRKRAEQSAGDARSNAMRRRGVRPGQPDEDPIARAVQAMTRAEARLEALSTSEALPHEMEALQELLKAQAENRKRQVARQQGGGMGQNRQTQDLSTLFDRELQRQQQTNYETPSTSETQDKKDDSALDKIRELARRQDELSHQQQDLAKQREKMSADELKRQLERLTREQSELRRQAEELSRQLSSENPASQSQSGKGQGGQAKDQKNASGSGGQSMRDISEEMRNAANELRREDPQQASARSGRALQQLRDLEQKLQTAQPDDRRRRLGDMGLEARQLADAQRQIASEVSRIGKNSQPSGDALRHLAADKERLADRVDKLQKSVKQMEGADRANGRDAQAIADASKELERQQLPQRMRESAATIRDAAGAADSKSGAAGDAKPDAAKGQQAGLDSSRQATTEQDLARALDRVAEKIGGASGTEDADSRKLSEQLARTRDVRDRMADVQRKIDEKAKEAGEAQKKSPGAAPTTASSGQPQAGQTGSGEKAAGQNASGQKSAADRAASGSSGTGGSGEMAQLRDEYTRLYRQAQELMDQVRRDNPQAGVGGYTPMRADEFPEGVPGMEGRNQDFAKWKALKDNITLALERTESSLAKQLKDKETRDRLNAGADASAPEAYRRMVDKYFQSLASRKREK